MVGSCGTIVSRDRRSVRPKEMDELFWLYFDEIYHTDVCNVEAVNEYFPFCGLDKSEE